MNELSDQEIEKKIYSFIEKNPGLYLSKIVELLDMPISSLENFLQKMQREGKITTVEKTGYKRFYVDKGKLRAKDKRVVEIRDRIYYLISKNPGLHLSKIAELMDIRVSLLEYHLNYLEKNSEITAATQGGHYKRYYTKDSGVGYQDKKIIDILRKEIPLKIVVFLLENPNSRYKEIQEHLGISAPLLTYHLNKLMENKIVNEPTYTSKEYSIINEKEITKFLKKYRMYSLIGGFKDVWADLDYYDR